MQKPHPQPDVLFFSKEVCELFFLPPLFLACQFVALLMVETPIRFNMLFFIDSVSGTAVEIKKPRRVFVFLGGRPAVFNF